MTISKSAINVLVKDNRFLGKSNQEIEDDFKLMLKQKLIDVDDYSNAMELIYDE